MCRFRGLPVSVTPPPRTRWRALSAATSAAELKYLITIQQYNWNMRGGLKDKTSVTTCFISCVPLILVLVAEEASSKERSAALAGLFIIRKHFGRNTATSCPLFHRILTGIWLNFSFVLPFSPFFIFLSCRLE